MFVTLGVFGTLGGFQCLGTDSGGGGGSGVLGSNVLG